MLWLLAILVINTYAAVGAKVDINDVRSALTLAYNELMSFYEASTGYFGGYDYFWTTANQIETVANYYALTGDPKALTLFENSFKKIKPRYCNCYRDDMLWYVLAWARVFEVTGNKKYLNQSVEIFDNIVGPWNAWNATCGGIMWYVDNPYRNSITNELFFSAAMTLHYAFEDNLQIIDDIPRSTSGLTFAQWAEKDWTWMNATTLYLPAIGLFNDGMPNNNCSLQAPSQPAIWTYNQGVFLDGMTKFDRLKRNKVSQFGYEIALKSFSYFSGSHSDGIMREVSCNSDTGYCDGQDGRQFKGAFVRHLAYAATSPLFGDRQVVEIWLKRQVDSILSNSSLSVTLDSGVRGLLLGQLWQGPSPIEGGDTMPWIGHGSAMDALCSYLLVRNTK